MVWLLTAVLPLAFLVGLATGRHQRYASGVEQGRRLTELEHGWRPSPVPGGHRRRWWSVLDRKVPEPALVERHITPTRETPR